MKGIIYKITNDINKKIYIGKTLSTIEKRFDEHIRDANREKKEKRPLYNAINKYGKEHFHIEIIEECDIKELSKQEIYWIGYYDTYKNGYNATLGGDGVQLYDYEFIVELYDSGLNGREICQQLNCDSRTVMNALRSAERDPLQNSLKKRVKGMQAFDKQGKLLYTFDSESEAARFLINENIAQTDEVKNVVTAIGRVAHGKRKTAYGMIWKFLEKKGDSNGTGS